MSLSQLLTQNRQITDASYVPRPARGQQWRLPLLCTLLLLAFGCNLFLAHITPAPEASQDGFLAFWLLTYLPTGFAGVQVLLTAVVSGDRVVNTPKSFPQAIEVAASEGSPAVKYATSARSPAARSRANVASIRLTGGLRRRR